MSEHTHGPWILLNPIIDDDFTKPRTVIEKPKGESLHKERVADVYAWGSTRERDANAHLIAAAPELLATMEEIQTWLISPATDKVTLDHFANLTRKVIAKAKGLSDAS